jgi:tetratricopeptide (TPR) repeat protein
MSKSPADLIKQIERLFQKKKYQSILDMLPDAFVDEQKNAVLYAWKARACVALEKTDESFANAQKAIDIDPDLPMAYHARGNFWATKNEHEKAIADYTKAIGLNEKYAISYNNRGLVWQDRAEFDKAIADYTTAIELDINDSDVYYNRGNAWIKKNEYDNGIKDYTQAITLNKNDADSYYNRAEAYKDSGEFERALSDYEQYIRLANDSQDYFTKIAKAEIENLKQNIEEKWRAEITTLISKIKKLLLFEKPCITHYTTFTAAKTMILGGSLFRLSEGAYLNDTSEGRQILEYLAFSITKDLNYVTAEDFTEKPFIGSFVNEIKHNDLTLWRMYGKESHAEASGCALTINRQQFISGFESKLSPDRSSNNSGITESRYSFYKIAYIHNEEFVLPRTDDEDEEKNEQDTKELNRLLNDLKEKIAKLDNNQRVDIAKSINEIVYLFKSAEYQYEHEVRLVVDGLGIKKEFNNNANPPKVYIEMIDIVPVLSKITLGPKVERADEWAAVFNYHIKEISKKEDVKIVISHLPFK